MSRLKSERVFNELLAEIAGEKPSAGWVYKKAHCRLALKHLLTDKRVLPFVRGCVLKYKYVIQANSRYFTEDNALGNYRKGYDAGYRECLEDLLNPQVEKESVLKRHIPPN